MADLPVRRGCGTAASKIRRIRDPHSQPPVQRLPAGRHAASGGRCLQCPDEDVARRPQDARALQDHGRLPGLGTPEQFKNFVDGQIALWKGVIDKEGLKLDVN
jgi:hypothetical protein